MNEDLIAGQNKHPEPIEILDSDLAVPFYPDGSLNILSPLLACSKVLVGQKRSAPEPIEILDSDFAVLLLA